MVIIKSTKRRMVWKQSMGKDVFSLYIFDRQIQGKQQLRIQKIKQNQ